MSIFVLFPMAFQTINDSAVFSPIMIFLSMIAVLLAVVHFWQQSRRHRKIGDLIPGPPTIPLFGNALSLINKESVGKNWIE